MNLTMNTKKQIVQEVISKLSEKQREIIILRYVDDFNVEQISEKLNIPESLVESRLSDACKNIQDEVLKIQERDDIKLHSSSPVDFFILLLKDSTGNESNIDYSFEDRMHEDIANTTDSSDVKIGNDSTMQRNIGDALSESDTASNKAYVPVDAKAGIPLIAKATIGVLLGALLITGIYFGVGKQSLDKEDKSSNAEETMTDLTQNTDDTLYSALDTNVPGQNEVNKIGYNNTAGLTFVGLGYDQINFTYYIVNRSNHEPVSISDNASFEEVDNLFNTQSQPVRFKEESTYLNGAAEGEPYNVIGTVGIDYKEEKDYAFRPNEDFSMLIGGTADGNIAEGCKKIYCVYDPTVGKFRFAYYEENIDGKIETKKYAPEEQMYLDDNLTNYMLFFYNRINAINIAYGIDKVQVEDGKITHITYTANESKTVESDLVYDENGRLYEVTISGNNVTANPDYVAYDWYTKTANTVGINMPIKKGTYRFIYDDENLFRYVTYLNGDGTMELIHEYYYSHYGDTVPYLSQYDPNEK